MAPKGLDLHHSWLVYITVALFVIDLMHHHLTLTKCKTDSGQKAGYYTSGKMTGVYGA